MDAIMSPKTLEARTRFWVLLVAMLVVVYLGNGAYRASNFCLAETSWTSDQTYKLEAVRMFADADLGRYDEPAGPVIELARTGDRAKLTAFLEANPTAVVARKAGWSEYQRPTVEDWLAGRRSKTVSIRRFRNTDPQKDSYFYAHLDNCGKTASGG